jgi:hypothetical protein
MRDDLLKPEKVVNMEDTIRLGEWIPIHILENMGVPYGFFRQLLYRPIGNYEENCANSSYFQQLFFFKSSPGSY